MRGWAGLWSLGMACGSPEAPVPDVPSADCLRAVTHHEGRSDPNYDIDTSNDVYVYAPDGRALTHERDDDDDGDADFLERWTYDGAEVAAWLLVWGPPEPGLTRRRTTYAYDADRNRVSAEQDNGDDGSVDARWTYTWADGRLIAEVDEARGEVRHVGTYTYDPSGRLTERRLESTTGAVLTWRHTWDGDRHASEAYDDQGAGAGPERVTAWTYDAEGRVVVEAVDDAWPTPAQGEGADGKIDRRERSTWEGERLLSVEASNAADERVRRWVYTYDAEDRLIQLEQVSFSRDPGGLRDWLHTTTYAPTECP